MRYRKRLSFAATFEENSKLFFVSGAVTVNVLRTDSAAEGTRRFP